MNNTPRRRPAGQVGKKRPLRASLTPERALRLARRVVYLLGEGEVAANGVAERQRGLITAEQARICGLGTRAVQGRLRRRTWVGIRRGVYSVVGKELGPLAQVTAAMLAAPPGAFVSHLTAARIWELIATFPPLIELSVLGDSNPGRLEGCRVHRTSRAPTAVLWRHGIPVTSSADTLIDMAALLDVDSLEAAVAMSQRKHQVGRAALREIVEAAGPRPGIAKLRAVITEPRLTRSDGEQLLLRLVRAAELPEPVPNEVIEGKELDLYWPDARLAVEVDAYSTHGTVAAFEDDHLLDADFEAAGIKVLRFTRRRIRASPYAVIARIAAVLALRRGGLPPVRRRR